MNSRYRIVMTLAAAKAKVTVEQFAAEIDQTAIALCEVLDKHDPGTALVATAGVVAVMMQCIGCSRREMALLIDAALGDLEEQDAVASATKNSNLEDVIETKGTA